MNNGTVKGYHTVGRYCLYYKGNFGNVAFCFSDDFIIAGFMNLIFKLNVREIFDIRV